MTEKKYYKPALMFGLVTAFLGSFWLIAKDYNNEPSLAYFLWFMVVLIANLTVVYKYGKFQLSFVTLGMITAYVLIALGFIFNTKEHTLNFILELALLPFINLSLSGVDFFSSPLLRFIVVLVMDYIPGKVIGPFLSLSEGIRASRSEERKQARQQKIAVMIKTTLLFALLGLPVIFIVLALLSSANEQFSKEIGKLFEDYLDLGLWIIRALVFALIAFYMLGEAAFVKNILQRQEKIENVKAELSPDTSRVFTYAVISVMTILNLFYIVFIVFELKFDFANVRDLLAVKSVDTYAELAVSRFWELIWVALINLIIVYFVLKPKQMLRSNIFKAALLTNAGFLFLNTLFMIFSALRRLDLYESGYGFTKKRFLAHTFLPVLVLFTIIFFANFLISRYAFTTKLAFVSLLLFVAIHVFLPSTYIVNRLNYELYNDGKIVVYDPSYLVSNPEFSWEGLTLDLPYNDVRDQDAYILAVRVVKDTDLASDYDRRDTIQAIEDELDDVRNADPQDWKHWREFNFMRYALEKALVAESEE